jgi:hypothetical protein
VPDGAREEVQKGPQEGLSLRAAVPEGAAKKVPKNLKKEVRKGD